MRIAPLIAIVFVVALAGSDAAPHVLAAAPTACEALAQTSITNGTVVSAQSVQAGAFAPPNATNPNAAAAYKTPPKYLGYEAPQAMRLKTNLEAVYAELKK